MTSSLVAYHAKWIFPVDKPPVENGYVLCRDGKISEVQKGNPEGHVVDLGPVAIIPGLVNAHTHLEFSDLDQPLGDPGKGFVKWIESVIRHRSERSSSTNDSIQQGIEESLRSGVVAIGEIATTPWDLAYDTRLAGTIFHEQLGNDPLQSISKTTDVESRLSNFHLKSWSPGVSPHAPYSTSLNLFQNLVELATRKNARVAMHLAESLEEVEFVETGKGEFAEMLDRLGISFRRISSITTLDYLAGLSEVDALIVHGNYLNVDELQFIAENKNQHIVFCPRTHAYFGHSEYPLRTMLDLEINVAVGTDSRASNPDLNLFRELQHISKTQPTVRPQEILHIGTLAGAKSLGLEDRFGSLSADKRDTFCVVETEWASDDPFEDLFRSESHCYSKETFLERLKTR